MSNTSPRASRMATTTTFTVAFPLHPIGQCCQPNCGAPTCEISAVRTPPPLGLWTLKERVNIEVRGPGVLPDVDPRRRRCMYCFTCEISSVTNHPAEGRASRGEE